MKKLLLIALLSLLFVGCEDEEDPKGLCIFLKEPGLKEKWYIGLNFMA